MNILVTGGSGYIGSALVEHLLRQGHEIRVFETQIFGNPIAHLAGPKCEFIEGDIRDYKMVRGAMGRSDAVVHLAGVVTDELVDMNEDFSADVNVGGTENIVRACEYHNISRMVYASSSSVYGTAAEEGVPTESDTPKPKTAYAMQKLKGEEIVLAYGDSTRTATAVRQATAMGPAPRMRLDTVVNIFSKQAYFDGLITPYGGDQYRSNVYIQDVARFYELLCMVEGKKVNRRPWNLTDENQRVREIATRVMHAAQDLKMRAEIETVDIADDRSYRLDGSAVERELGFQTDTGIYAAALHNFAFFKKTNLDPTDPIYNNNKRMGPLVRGEK